MNITRTIDTLGDLRAQIADLQAHAKDLENEIKAQGDGAYEGQYYRATVSTSIRKTIDWKAIAAKLKPSRQLVAAHTKESEPTTSLRVVARIKNAA